VKKYRVKFLETQELECVVLLPDDEAARESLISDLRNRISAECLGGWISDCSSSCEPIEDDEMDDIDFVCGNDGWKIKPCPTCGKGRSAL
jgi:hypothetical protein